MEQDTRCESTRTAVETDRGFRLNEGVELLGKYRGSGLQEPPYLLRRPDGQVVQVSRLLYLIASALEVGKHPDPAPAAMPEDVAARVTIGFGQDVSADNVIYLIDKKLRPAGLIASHGDGLDPVAPRARANPILALRLRLPVVPERAHRWVSTACEPLFRPAVVISALVGMLVVDAWMAVGLRSELSGGMRQLIYQPQLLLGITLLTIVSGAFHEIGHAAAARYSGATPGAMGAGIYLVWPVFYTDVTDAYRLDRRGRLRTDLGGVYFNVLFALAVAAVYLQTGYKPLLVFVVVAQLETLRQFLPFVRLDGYYVVSDLAGVPNLFTYMQPVLVTLLRRGDEETRRAAQARLDELNPRARLIITGWVCLTAPVLLVHIVLFLMVAPRLAGAAWGSAGGQLREMTTGGRIDLIGVFNGTVGLMLLTLPLVGMTFVFSRLMLRLSDGARTWWKARPLATATAGVALATLVTLQVAVEWPNTFASALKHAQVAQAIEEARDEGRTEELAALLPATPPAEPSPVAAEEAGGDGEDEAGTDDTTASSSTSTETTTSSTRRQDADDTTTASTSEPDGDRSGENEQKPSDGSTTTTSVLPGQQPGGIRDVPPGRGPGTGGGPGSGGGSSPTTSPAQSPSPATTTTTAAPTQTPSLLRGLLDWLF